MPAKEVLLESLYLIPSWQQYIFLYAQQVQKRFHRLHLHYFKRKGLLIALAFKWKLLECGQHPRQGNETHLLTLKKTVKDQSQIFHRPKEECLGGEKSAIILRLGLIKRKSLPASLVEPADETALCAPSAFRPYCLHQPCLLIRRADHRPRGRGSLCWPRTPPHPRAPTALGPDPCRCTGFAFLRLLTLLRPPGGCKPLQDNKLTLSQIPQCPAKCLDT